MFLNKPQTCLSILHVRRLVSREKSFSQSVRVCSVFVKDARSHLCCQENPRLLPGLNVYLYVIGTAHTIIFYLILIIMCEKLSLARTPKTVIPILTKNFLHALLRRIGSVCVCNGRLTISGGMFIVAMLVHSAELAVFIRLPKQTTNMLLLSILQLHVHI